MLANRGRTKPELKLAKALWSRGLRYLTFDGFKARFKVDLLGKPDLIFSRSKLVVFMDGCFWHGCPTHGTLPRGDKRAFWLTKVESNRFRDKQVTLALQDQGWTVLRIWEHELRRGLFENTVESVASMVRGTSENDR